MEKLLAVPAFKTSDTVVAGKHLTQNLVEVFRCDLTFLTLYLGLGFFLSFGSGKRFGHAPGQQSGNEFATRESFSLRRHCRHLVGIGLHFLFRAEMHGMHVFGVVQHFVKLSLRLVDKLLSGRHNRLGCLLAERLIERIAIDQLDTSGRLRDDVDQRQHVSLHLQDRFGLFLNRSGVVVFHLSEDSLAISRLISTDLPS